MDNKENPLLIPEGSTVTELDVRTYNTRVINSIKKKYPVLRQDSKAP